MNLKPVAAAALLAATLSSASAMSSLNLGPATVVYDETTSFGFISSWFSSAVTYGFSWTVPISVQVASFGPPALLNVPLPDYTLTVNAGWTISNAAAFLGNLAFVEVGAATTNIIANGDLSIDGGATTPIGPASLAWTSTPSGPGYLLGYFADTLALAGAFNSVAVTNSAIDLSATGGIFFSISANPQNKLEITFDALAVPVPEPETYAMLLAGLGALGLLARRRRTQA